MCKEIIIIIIFIIIIMNIFETQWYYADYLSSSRILDII